MAEKTRVLIIDDEKNVTAVLRAMLETVSVYQVEVANSGQAGFEKARAFRPHLILLDVMMPDFGGDAFAEKIKKDLALRDTPIIFLTGIVTKEEVRASGGMIGGYPYLAKPITRADELISSVETHVRPR